MIAHIKNLFYSFISAAILLCCSCNANNEAGLIYSSHCKGSVAKVDIWQLLQFHHKQLIQIEGVYRHRFEMNALFSDSHDKDKGKALWLDFSTSDGLGNEKPNQEIFDKKESLNDLCNKRIKVIGVLDLHDNGHMNWYKGTISNICYIAVIN